jgi:hypothetical protein
MRGGARIKCKMKFTIEFIIEILCGVAHKSVLDENIVSVFIN